MLRNVIFPNYGGSPLVEDDFDEKKMLMEKPRLKDELDRVPIRTYKSLDRPFVQISSSEETDICGVPSGIGMNGWSRDLEVRPVTRLRSSFSRVFSMCSFCSSK
ncbi:hypothetical protein ZWY2020_041534 [Hordeum vulgare]|nr:hypothetical protein ZWY2020_041534 [Hordeum vulgare]